MPWAVQATCISFNSELDQLGAETTDAAHSGGAEGSEGSKREMEIEPADGPLHYGSSVQEMHDALNNEQTLCSRDGEIRFSAMIQHVLLSVLQTMNAGWLER